MKLEETFTIRSLEARGADVSPRLEKRSTIYLSHCAAMLGAG